MNDEVSTDMYIDARSAFVRVDTELKEVADVLRVVSDALKRQPGKFVFENVEPGLPVPAGLVHDAISIYGSQWKSAEQIQTLLAKWHDARKQMVSTYNDLPDHRRDGVQAPPRTG